MVKFRTRFSGVPVAATLAFVPAVPVVVVPTLTVPAGPCGSPKFRTAVSLTPVLVTVGVEPVGRLVTDPTVTRSEG